MLRRHKKLTALIVMGTLGIGGGAFAYWTQTGSGTGAATTGTTTAITVIQDSVATGLFPGGPAGTLSGHFSNPSATAVHSSALTAAVSPAFTARADITKPACTSADFTIGGTAGPYVVAPGVVTTWSGLTVSMVNGALNQDNCKSVTPGIDYTAAQ